MSITAEWTSTLTPAAVAERICAAIDASPGASVCLITHAKADGDAVGTTLALARAVHHAGGTATIVHQAPFPDAFRGVCEPTNVLLDNEGGFEDPGATDAALVLVVDTGSWGQVAGAETFLRARAGRTVIVDHHRSGDADMTDDRLIEVDEPAACAIAAKVVSALLNLDSPARLPVDVATPLYLGLATDTGWFKHPSVTPSAMRLAGDLLEAGVDHNALYLGTEQSDPVERLLMVRAATGNLQLHEDDRIAVMHLTEQDFEDTGALPEHTGGIIDIPKTVTSVEVSVFAYPITGPDGVSRTKVSMRSKAGGADVDVNAVAQRFGGGGHKHAAGCKLEQDLIPALGAIVEAISEQLP